MTPSPSSLDSIVEALWQQQETPPETTQAALAQLSDTMLRCVGGFAAGQVVETQRLLDDTLVQVLLSMKTMNMNPDLALERSLARQESATQPPRRKFHLYRDRLEVHVGDQLRGGWPLYSQADVDAVVALARTFECDIHHHDAEQLDLFVPSADSTSTEPPLAPLERQPASRNRFRYGLGDPEAPPKLRLVSGGGQAQPAPSA